MGNWDARLEIGSDSERKGARREQQVQSRVWRC